MDPAYIRLECLKLVVGESKGASVNHIIARAAYLERLVVGGFDIDAKVSEVPESDTPIIRAVRASVARRHPKSPPSNGGCDA
ncbi:hypothetical protein HH800_01050 [Sphingobium yanoikuyae]|uniref:Uncharacterized protein n=1 Tax=Sphingobium yanoikuyae TaxID=13690 RepID=A0A6M4G5D3_SPHYA|nr:hypothetical protein [Sphingobium yanoikuyae]QJR00907.1 hypothetical protein HH800_01050 [Sphingobium yanoikuyae]